MLKMAQIEYIKYLYENEGKSLSYIAKTMHISYKTVKKYALQYNWSPNEIKMKTDRYPVLGPYLDIVDTWLEDDLKRPRKQRHTAQRVFDRLVDEQNFKGSIRTVSDYVAKKKKELYLKSDGYLPLEHIPGEAQLDFGELTYIDKDKEKKGYFLTLSFPYSNAAFTQIFKGQNQECVMEGLKRIFEHINGVPSVLVMDNMAAVVSKILPHGERELTENFRRFALHYRFKPVFCNPASGNEKGNVENKIGYHRRNWFVPVPHIDDMEEYNHTLWNKAHKDMNREHYRKQQAILTLWQQEQQKLLYLPENEYDIFKLEQASVDKYGYVKVDNNFYSISPELHRQQVTLRIYYNKVEIYYDHNLLKTYNRSYEKKEEIYDWTQYLNILTKKPGALEHTKFYSQIPKVWQEHLKKLEKAEKKTALMLLKEIVDANALEIGEQALLIATLYGKTDTESVRQCYYNLTHETKSPEPCKLNTSTPILNYQPELSQYDRLAGEGVM